jgi:hypothetical protein
MALLASVGKASQQSGGFKMACAIVEIKDRRTSSISAKGLSIGTPTAGITPDHVSCELSLPTANEPVITVEIEFSRSEVAEMIGAFPDYIPTMDAVLRFMRRNPRTSKEMIEAEAEIYYRNEP